MGSLVIIVLSALLACASTCDSEGEVLARTETGWVRGAWRESHRGRPYASFRGIPYGKQPLGELRFKELEPAEPWEDVLDATVGGPICHFHDIFYSFLQTPVGVSEACIYANVHVPEGALPDAETGLGGGGLPVVVYIHGGGWVCGSGDADFNGPEYLVDKDVIAITFNYRLDIFGFLSLGTAKIPGNNGMRDALTLLRWVQRNVHHFGGDPTKVTLAGQSAGSIIAHLLSLSPLSDGLFNRLWLMSGTANPRFYTASPVFANQLATSFLTALGLNGTDDDTVYDQLVQMPVERIQNASGVVLATAGILSFSPVVEAEFEGVTRMVEDEPETLLANGRGKDIPLVIGFTNNEGQTFRPRLTAINAVELYRSSPLAALSPNDIVSYSAEVTAVMAQKVKDRYFGEEPTYEKFIKLVTDSFFAYPAVKLAKTRAQTGGAPVWSYKYGYTSVFGALKIAFNLTYTGAAHVEDLTYMYKVNSFPVEYDVNDDNMIDWMSGFLANYAITGEPAPAAGWPAQGAQLGYQDISVPQQYHYTGISEEDLDVYHFFETLPDPTA